MMSNTEAKILATLEMIHESLGELVVAAKELVVVEKTITKRQGAKDSDFKESFKAFAEEIKIIIQGVFTPQPLPEPPIYRVPQPRHDRHEIKIIHVHDYDNNKHQLEMDLNKLLEGGNWILAGMTDYIIMFHRMVQVEEVDAEFIDDGGKINVQ